MQLSFSAPGRLKLLNSGKINQKQSQTCTEGSVIPFDGVVDNSLSRVSVTDQRTKQKSAEMGYCKGSITND